MKTMFRSHRGGSFYTPESTMPAFRDAIEQGFEYIEVDPRYTLDGKIILLHDGTINRTCRNADGSEIKEDILPEEHTYEELLQYDAGIAFGEEFKGTKLPLLDDLLKLAEGKDVRISLDKKIATEDMEPLMDLVAKYNAKVSWFAADIERIEKIQSRFPDAYIEYEGPATEEMLEKVTSMVKQENLLVWLYLDKPNFSWLEPIRKTSPENCARVRRYAKTFGIANINNPYDVREALMYEPDVIEV